MQDDIVVHLNPILRHRANFIIRARINEEDPEATKHWEQLWVRKINQSKFEMCCIPFSANDLSLFDEVETTKSKHIVILDRVAKLSNHFTFRIWFGDTNNPNITRIIAEEVLSVGCRIEWYSRNWAAIDANQERVDALVGLLDEHEEAGGLIYECAHSGWPE